MDIETVAISRTTGGNNTPSPALGDKTYSSSSSSSVSDSVSLLTAEICLSCGSLQPDHPAGQSVSSKSEEVDAAFCGPCSLTQSRKVGDRDAKVQLNDVSYFWPSPINSACVLLVLHLGASPLILAPALCWKYGVILVYIVVIFIVGLSSFPMHVLESFIGHYSVTSICEGLARMGPILRVLGHCLLVLTVLMSVYYTELVAWVLVYLQHVLQGTFQWSSCSPLHNSRLCYSAALQRHCSNAQRHLIYHNFHCMSATDFCREHRFLHSNGTHCWGRQLAEQRLVHRRLVADPTPHNAVPFQRVVRRVPPELDFFRSFLDGSDWSEVGPQARQKHRRVIAVAYAVEFLLLLVPCLSLKLSSLLAKVAACATPVLLIIVLVRVLLLPGAAAGISRMFSTSNHVGIPSESALQMCADAILMAHTSAALGSGIVATVASRDRQPRAHTTAISMLAASANLLLGLVMSMLLFAALENLQIHHGVVFHASVANDVSPAELVLVPLSALFHRVPFGDLYATMFYIALLLHSLASLAAVIVSVAVNVSDSLPYFGRRSLCLSSLAVVSVTCGLGFLLVGFTWSGIRVAVGQILSLQWAVGFALLSAALGLKVATHGDRAAALRLALGRLVRPLQLSWLCAAPLAAVTVVIIISGRLSGADGASSAAQGVGYSALVLPLIAAVVTALYVCTAVPCWELLTDKPELADEAKPTLSSEE